MGTEQWRQGDRAHHRPTGQRGVVEETGDGVLRVLWGVANGVELRGWVREEECSWEPGPGGEVVDVG